MNFYWQDIQRNILINYHIVDNLDSLNTIIRTIKANYEKQGKNNKLWFRGSVDFEYKLIPSLYRNSILKDKESFHDQIDELYEFHDEQLNMFQSGIQSRLHHIFENHQAIPSLESSFNWGSIMQHYSAPSWLLDWSLDKKIALYFAIEHLFNMDMRVNNIKIQPCIWVMNPQIMNELFWNEINNETIPNTHCIDNIVEKRVIKRRIPTFYDLEKEKKSTGYHNQEYDIKVKTKKIHLFETKNVTRPLNLYPLQNTQRITTQKGMFTAFPIQPYKNSSVNQYKPYEFFLPLDSYSYSNQFLSCILLHNFSQLKKDLENDNFSPWDVYPEIGYRPGISY